MSLVRVKDTYRIQCEGCSRTVPNHQWGKIKAVGWFFARGGKNLAYCPEHLPPWVEKWRADKTTSTRQRWH